YTLTVDVPAITLAPGTLPAAVAGVAYHQALGAGGGTPPYTFAVTAGALPAGLTLANDGTLSGTPSAGGTFNVTLTATDALGFEGTQAYTLAVGAPTIVLAPATLPAGTGGSAYNEALGAGGGPAPYSFAGTAGARPAPARPRAGPGGVA